ncbi:MAG TPA: lysylphosphatidylglycerol synthase transmembrane domain-containing protein, partial [Nitrococcus sp.]|nr:lysylphosphatidylglycerol synthase transmembrane domain-containing protein [Nitrococcus sp.]
AGANPTEAMAAAARVNGFSWLLILSLSLLNYGLRFLRWDGYLRHLGNRLAISRHLIIYLAGFALTTTPGKTGEAIRALYLKPLGVGYERSIAVLYTERLVDLISIALLAMLLVELPAPGYRWGAVIASIIAVALLLLQRAPVLKALIRMIAYLPISQLRRALQGALDCLAQATALLHFRLLLLGIGVGLISWGAEAIAFYHVAHVLNIPINPMVAIGIYATAILAGALSFLPGGLGSTEAVMVSLLLLAGASLPAAVATTTVVRIATLWFAVVLGVTALIATEASRRRYSLGNESPRDKVRAGR